MTNRQSKRRAFGRAAAIAAAASAALYGPAAARAADKTWTNTATGATWSTAGNWNPAAEPDATDNVILPGTIPTGGGTITLAAGELADTLTVNNTYTLTGGDLTLTTGSIQVADTFTATLNSQLKGTYSTLTISGVGGGAGGTLVLGNNTNAFTANIVVDNARLSVTGDNGGGGDPLRLGPGSKTITLQNGGRLIATTTLLNATSTNTKSFVIGTGGGTLEAGSGITLDDAGQFSGTGDLTKLGSSTLILGNNYTGFDGANIFVNAGTLQLQNNVNAAGDNLPSQSVKSLITLASGTALNLRSNSSLAFNNPVTVAANATLNADRASSGADYTQTAGTLSIGAQTLTVTGANRVTAAVTSAVLSGNPTFNPTSGRLSIGFIDGGGANRTITVTGGGQVAVAGPAVNLVGTTSVPVTGSQVRLDDPAAFGSAAAVVATGTAPGIVQVGAAAAGYTYSLPGTGIVGGDAAFLGSLNFGAGGNATNTTTAGAFPETVAETAVGVLTGNPLAFPNDASRVFGIAGNLAESVTVGAGTPWKGVSNDRVGRLWPTGTITANGDFEIRANPGNLTLGNGTTAGQVTIASSGPVTANVTASVSGGVVLLDDATAGYGAGLTFAVNNGAFLQTVSAPSLGTGATPADNAKVNVLAGGTLNPNGGATLNGNVTIQPGGMLQIDDATNITGTGTITQFAGSITRVTANGSNALAGSQSAGTVAGSIVRIETDAVALLGTKTDPAAVVRITGGDRTLGTPIAMNADPAVAGSGLFTIDGASRTVRNQSTTGLSTINIGPDGATIAASNGFTLTFTNQTNTTAAGGIRIDAGDAKVHIGIPGATTIDGQAKATGTVSWASTFTGGNPSNFNASGFYAGSVDVDAGTFTLAGGGVPYRIGADGTGDTTIKSGASFNVNTGTTTNTNLVVDAGATSVRLNGSGTTGSIAANVGSLAGEGNVVIGPATSDAAVRTLNVGFNNLSTTFNGVLSTNGTGAGTGAVTKQGTGTWTLGGNNTYRGVTTVSAGTLLVNGTHATAAAPAANYVVAASASATSTLGGTGTINLAAGATVTATGSGSNAATIAPGVGSILGTLTVAVAGTGSTGGVTFGAGSVFEVNTAGTGSADRLAVTGTGGNLNLAAADTLSVLSTNGGTNVIATYGGALTSVFDTVMLNGATEAGTSAAVTNPAGFTAGSGTLFTADSGRVAVFYNTTAKNIEVSAVPEPATAGLLAAAAVGLLARRRRRA